MFKCWMYISGEENALKSEEYLSDKKEVYGNKNLSSEKETGTQSSYIPGMRKFGFFDRIHFS